MKKILLMITLVAGSFVFAQAQSNHAHKTPEQRAKHKTEMLQSKLALSTDQSAKVNAILLNQARQMDSLKVNRPDSAHKINKQAFKTVKSATDAKLNTVLTAEQQAKYAQLKADMKGKMGDRHGKRSPVLKAQRLTKVLQKKLTLSADQYAKVNTILLKRVTQMDSLKANRSTADRTVNKDSRKTILMQTDTELKAVLNADQLKNYTELKARFKERMKTRHAAKAPTAG
jgi:Spy/CpxP family protein refolding chaperone